MYTEPFKFEFIIDMTNSERMKLLSDMFMLTEQKHIDPINYCGYVVKQNGVVEFTSSHPDLTSAITSWLEKRSKEGDIKVIKPSYLSNA